MRRILYKIIYHPKINRVLLRVSKKLGPLPKRWQLVPVGRITLPIAGHPIVFESNQTCNLVRLLYWEGTQAFEYVDLFADLASRVRGFIDVGSNVGFYSLLAARCNPAVRILALEPASGPLHYLRLNIAANGMEKRIGVMPVAASRQAGVLRFNEVRNAKYPDLEHHLNGDGGFIPHSATQNSRVVEVSTDTLDHVLALRDFGPVDLVKIDTEGTEDDVLAGFAEHLDRDRPIIICEMLFGRIEAKLEAIMGPRGYLYFSHRPDGLHRRERLVRATDDGVQNIFFVHPDKLELIGKHIVEG
jgi:FkbM family methyltransferase